MHWGAADREPGTSQAFAFAMPCFCSRLRAGPGAFPITFRCNNQSTLKKHEKWWKINSLCAQCGYTNGNLFFVFRQNLHPRKVFWTISRSFSTFSSSRKLGRRREKFWNYSWRQRDSNGPKIVEIGATLAIFRPFQISRKVSVGGLYLNLLRGYKK